VTVEELASMPRLGQLYRRAIKGGLWPALARSVLPDTELVVADVAVDRRRLADYDRVCGFTLSDQLPATYPHVLAFPLSMELMSRPDFPMPLVGLVHVANRIEICGPLRASDPFEIHVRAEGLRAHDRGRQVDLVAEARVAGTCVWRGRSTYLHRERRQQGASTKPTGTKLSATGPSADADSEGMLSGTLWQVPGDIGHRYAAVSGDRNPIHTSRLAARALGFPRPIAHGMWTKARCVAAGQNRLPDQYTVDIVFKQPIRLPSTVRFVAQPMPAAAGGWRLAVHGAHNGRSHLVGEITSG
jgi:acyl dehydratase